MEEGRLSKSNILSQEARCRQLRSCLQILQSPTQASVCTLYIAASKSFRVREICLADSRLSHPSTSFPRRLKCREHTHSRVKTPNLHKGPNSDIRSIDAAVASAGIHSSILVIIIAILLIETNASRPAITPRQLVSLPPRPSGRKSDSCQTKCLTTSPRTPSISLSGSNRRAISWRNGSTSVGESVVAGVVEPDRMEVDNAERESKGPTNSAGPRTRLRTIRQGMYVKAYQPYP